MNRSMCVATGLRAIVRKSYRSNRDFHVSSAFLNDNDDDKASKNSATTNEWHKTKIHDLLSGARSGETDGIELDFPSDLADHADAAKTLEQQIPRRVKKDPREKSVVLFPGQGSQFVGMGNKLLEYPNVLDMYKMASEILGYDLLKLCLKGPKSELDKTVHCQPAVLVTSLAAVEKLKHDNPQAVENCVATGGFSVGEYAALTFAGSLTFQDAVHLINIRAKAMQKASDETPGGMMVVHLSADSKLGDAMKAAQLYMKERLRIEIPVCNIANFLYTCCKVVAGHKEGLYFIEKVQKEFKIRRVKQLPVSGAFHTELMASACEPLSSALSNLELAPPAIKVYSNVTGTQFHNVRHINRLLIKQLTNQVKWEQSVSAIYERSQGEEFPQTFECGPGSQLLAMLRLTNGKAYKSAFSVEV